MDGQHAIIHKTQFICLSTHSNHSFMGLSLFCDLQSCKNLQMWRRQKPGGVVSPTSKPSTVPLSPFDLLLGCVQVSPSLQEPPCFGRRGSACISQGVTKGTVPAGLGPYSTLVLVSPLPLRSDSRTRKPHLSTSDSTSLRPICAVLCVHLSS
jgi:hypothetical protein